MPTVYQTLVGRSVVVIPVGTPANFDSLFLSYSFEVSEDSGEGWEILPIKGQRNNVHSKGRHLVVFTIWPGLGAIPCSFCSVLFNLASVTTDNLERDVTGD